MCPWEMVGRCPFEGRPFSIELFCSIQATDLQERESSTRVVGREARLGFCLLIAFNFLAIFSFILSSYFCFLVQFNTLIPCCILISAFSLRSNFFSYFLIFAFSSHVKKFLLISFIILKIPSCFSSPHFPSVSFFSVSSPISYIIYHRTKAP